MKKIVLKISIGYSLLHLLLAILFLGFDLSFSSIVLTNLYNISLVLLIPLPLIWLSKIQHKIWQPVSMALYIGLIIFLIPFLLLFSAWAINDLKIGNGYRAIYKYEMKNGEELTIYRTPDQGAFGGDHIEMAIVKPIALIFERREWIPLAVQNDSSYVEVKDQKIPIPPLKDIYSKGDLKFNE